MRLILFITILLSAQAATGQFKMEDYLGNATLERELQSIEGRLDYANNTKFRSPIIREVEVRLRENSWGEGIEDYKLRFSPINPFEKIANRKYATALQSQLTSEYRMKLNNVLEKRYLNLINHWLLSEVIGISLEKAAFYHKLTEMISKQPDQFSIKEVIQIDREQLQTQLKIEDLELEKSQLEYLINQSYSYSGIIDWENIQLIDILHIQKRIIDLGGPNVNNNLSLINKEESILLEESLFNIKQKKSFSNIGYFQAEFREDDDQSFKQNLGFQIGISLPIVNNDRPDLERERLDIVEENLEFEEEKQSVSIQSDLNQIQLKNALKQYEIVARKEAKYADLLIHNLDAEETLDALTEINGFIYELRLSKAKVYHQALTKYINMLAQNGELSTAPFINHISADQSTFDLVPR